METLFIAETDRVRLTWSAPRSVRSGAAPCVVTPLDGGHVRLTVGRSEAVWLEEETTSLVLVQSLSGEPVSLTHRDPVVTSGLASADGGRVLHGPVRTGSQAGWLRLQVGVGSRTSFSLAMDVLPVKLGAPEVARMRAEVEAAAAGLAFSALRPVAASLAPEPLATSPPVWLAALRRSADDLRDAVEEIARRPLLETALFVDEQRPSAIRKPSGETRRAARRLGLGAPTLPARPARRTADTPAHRWLAGQVERVRSQVGTVLGEEAGRRPTPRREAVLHELEGVKDKLDRLLDVSVLEGGPGRAPGVPPLVLRRAPAYARAFAALRALDRGVALRTGALDVATQDLAALFETWSALAVVRVVAGVLGVPVPERPFGIDAIGTDVRLRRGRAHSVRLEGQGGEVEIAYNPRFPAPPALLTQRPDLLLTVRRGGQVRRVVLDAKYRRDDSAGYRRRHGAAGPPEDALGTLHRYRDAIVHPIDQAAALFPGSYDETFAASRLWTSLDGLGVGAIPIRPGDTRALETFIAGLVR